MWLVDRLVLQCCRLLDYNWTPLNWNRCWHWKWVPPIHMQCGTYVDEHTRLNTHRLTGWLLMQHLDMMSLLQMILWNPWIVSAKSGVVVTIHWNLSCVCWFACHLGQPRAWKFDGPGANVHQRRRTFGIGAGMGTSYIPKHVAPTWCALIGGAPTKRNSKLSWGPSTVWRLIEA